MINAGIEDGDTAIIESKPLADDGDIVAALIPDKGVTIKKFKVVDGRPVLIPANPKYSLITDNFVIQGKLINILKGK
jgi:repressor LexA